MFGYVRGAVCVPSVCVGNTVKNTAEILKQIDEASANGAAFAVFPELCVTGYTCGDLFFQDALTSSVADCLDAVCERTLGEDIVCIIGAPVQIGDGLYNCGIVVSGGRVRGIVPKTFLPNYSEYYEKRWFSSASQLSFSSVSSGDIGLHCDGSYDIPVGGDLLFRLKNGCSIGLELCEDLWTPVPPSSFLALAGARIIVNLSASNETVAKREYRRALVQNQSARLISGYVYASAGEGESTQDLVFSGHGIIAENGAVLCENEKYIDGGYVMCADIDTEKLRNERQKNKCFTDSAAEYADRCKVRTVELFAGTESGGELVRPLRRPFVPDRRQDRLERCRSIFEMQTAGLKKRLKTVGARPVIGISGGLDSTLALLVTCQAVHELGRDSSDVAAITMPCFGTTDRTYTNALELMRRLGVSALEIPIKDACRQHCRDIGHPENQYDTTFENVQARERTQVLMDYACSIGGLVVGTGDLSELALGWCTYNADHMSMYGVNAGVPKTLVKWMIDSIADYELFASCTDILRDIIDTPISPELLPPDENGNIAQETESIVGPYVLHDFFLFNSIRYGFAPDKVFFLACKAFDGEFDRDTVKKWLKTFYRRFFSQQFKRSCLPDGVKIGSLCLSPRGDWRMPSDASGALWADMAESL